MRDELRSAYAALGLEPGASLRVVKRQFKRLVRTWHPDRFVGDQQGIAEANHRLRVINQAYNTILASDFHQTIQQIRRDPPRPAPVRADGSQAPPDAPPRERPVSPPLTPDEIDAIVDAFKSRARRPSLGEQIRDDPWNRGLSLGVAATYVLEAAWRTWQNPWPILAAWHVKPTLPATGPVMASMVVSALIVWPLLYAIWYSDLRTRIAGWVFLLFVALVVPAFSAMMRL